MCTVCGCTAPASVDGAMLDGAALDYGANAARVSVPGLSVERTIRLEADVLGANNAVAARNRALFAAHGVTALNVVSSPGSGKTTLLVRTIDALRRRLPRLDLAVVEGDQQTSRDAERIRATGVPAIQVNTGQGCHLDAPMVAAAFARLPMHDGAHGHAEHAGHAHAHAHAHAHDHDHDHDHGHSHRHHEHHGQHGHGHDAGHDHLAFHGQPHGVSVVPGGDDGRGRRLLLIENVGNLVCPALWDLGEAAKVAVLSVTEGDDKPLKYPDLFAAAQLMLVNKVDLLEHVDFDVERCIDFARRVNPAIEVIVLSARTGQGLDGWLDWLERRLTPQPAPSAPTAPAPGRGDGGAGHARDTRDTRDTRARRIAELEAELSALRAATATAP